MAKVGIKATPAEYGAQEFERWTGKAISPEEYGQYISPSYYQTGGLDVDEWLRQQGLPGFAPVVRWGTISEGGHDYLVGYDASGNEVSRDWVGRTETAEMSEYEKARLAFEKEQLTWQIEYAQQQLEQQMAIQQLPYGQITPYQREELALQQQYQRWQQEEAQRQYGAQLAAQPISWLQYAAYAGKEPAIQPWMQPLMPQEYGGLGAGEQIPGWTAETMAGMPELTRPSRQYQARMGPTAMEQYLGYRQARTGERPEETQFRLWSTAPPSGAYGGLHFAR